MFIVNFTGNLFRIGGMRDQLNAISQPLHCCTGNKDRPFNGVVGLSFNAVSQCCEQVMLINITLCTGIYQGKAACAIGGFYVTRPHTALAY